VTDGDVVLAARVHGALRDAADPARAPRMQAYMRSAMPFLGVPVPAVRAIVRTEAKARPPSGTAALAGTAALLWRSAEYREHRYAATALTNLPMTRRLQTPGLLPLYREMIVTGAWWDHVDEVAHRIGALLRDFPDDLRPVVLEWSRDGDRWLRRVSIICQLGAKQRTDVALVAEAIVANLADKDFFVRKAIGWALRDYARTNPDWVRAFVASHDDTISPLSRREALKHLC